MSENSLKPKCKLILEEVHTLFQKEKLDPLSSLRTWYREAKLIRFSL